MPVAKLDLSSNTDLLISEWANTTNLIIDEVNKANTNLTSLIANVSTLSTRSISAGTGLTGGGNLTANRTISLNSTSIASLGLADTAIQAADLATVATSGDYDDLIDKPNLGNSAALNIGTTAGTVAAGDDSRIVNAVQTSRSVSTGTGLTGGGNLTTDRTLQLSTAAQASLGKADTAVQPADLANVAITGSYDDLIDKPTQIGFSANLGGIDQTPVTPGAYVKVNCTNEMYDIGGYYDAANARWTPPAGLISLDAIIYVNGTNMVSDQVLMAYIFKNGSSFKSTFKRSFGSTSIGISVKDYADGEDYYEFYTWIGNEGSGDKTISGSSTTTFFSGQVETTTEIHLDVEDVLSPVALTGYASDVSYDPTGTTLTANNVQTAINKLDSYAKILRIFSQSDSTAYSTSSTSTATLGPSTINITPTTSTSNLLIIYRFVSDIQRPSGALNGVITLEYYDGSNWNTISSITVRDYFSMSGGITNVRTRTSHTITGIFGQSHLRDDNGNWRINLRGSVTQSDMILETSQHYIILIEFEP